MLYVPPKTVRVKKNYPPKLEHKFKKEIASNHPTTHQQLQNYMKTKKTSAKHVNSSSSSCLLVTINSWTFPLLVYIAKWISYESIYCTKREFIHCFGNLKCLLQDPLRPGRRKSTLNSSLLMSNWVCKHGSAPSEPALKKKALLSDKHFLWFLITFSWVPYFLGLICLGIVLKHKLHQAFKQQTEKGSWDPRNP